MLSWAAFASGKTKESRWELKEYFRKTRHMTEDNQQAGRPSDPCVMVIFGAAGDLTNRKLIPALCNLAASKLLSQQLAIVGFGYNDFTPASFRQQFADAINTSPTTPISPS